MLIRHDPFSRLDRMADDMWRRFGATSMAMDVTRKEDSVEICMDLPGVRPEDIDVSVERNMLTVRAERGMQNGQGEPITQERAVGTMVREVMLGDTLDTDHIDARYEHGVLTIKIPRRPNAKTRRIEVQSGLGGRSAIETSSSESRTTSKATGKPSPPAKQSTSAAQKEMGSGASQSSGKRAS